MRLEELQLKKEELPILGSRCFQVPIHPGLLSPDLGIPQDLAPLAFERTAADWFEELRKYRNETELDDQIERWLDEVWLNEEPRVVKTGNRQTLEPFYWSDDHTIEPNGFARCMSISRDAGGSLYFPGSGGFDCETPLSASGDNPGYIRFSGDKTREFGFREFGSDDDRIVIVHVYGLHNVDHYPGALFLRNWAINYMNEALAFVAD